MAKFLSGDALREFAPGMFQLYELFVRPDAKWRLREDGV
jgi:hypothetical protein